MEEELNFAQLPQESAAAAEAQAPTDGENLASKEEESVVAEEKREPETLDSLGKLKQELGMTEQELQAYVLSAYRQKSQNPAYGDDKNMQQNAAGMARELERYRSTEEKAMKWSKFFLAHPEVAGYDALSKEVKSQIAAGAAPEEAYNAWRVRELERELAAVTQGEKNRAQAAGSVAGAGEEQQLDAFAAAFMSNLG